MTIQAERASLAPQDPPQATAPDGSADKRLNTTVFAVSGSIIAALALLHADRAWAWYTGVISYIFMGLLLAGEWLYRRYRLKT